MEKRRARDECYARVLCFFFFDFLYMPPPGFSFRAICMDCVVVVEDSFFAFFFFDLFRWHGTRIPVAACTGATLYDKLQSSDAQNIRRSPPTSSTDSHKGRIRNNSVTEWRRPAVGHNVEPQPKHQFTLTNSRSLSQAPEKRLSLGHPLVRRQRSMCRSTRSRATFVR